MGDGIGFDEAGPGNIPMFGADGDLILEQRAGFGAGQPFGM